MPIEDAGRPMKRVQLARLIDHTFLRASASEEDIIRLCDQAVQHKFATVAINSFWVPFCHRRLVGSDVGVDAAVGFPLGSMASHIKAHEARDAVTNGATEVDMVINIGALKSGQVALVETEIVEVVEASRPAPVKVILETCYLTDKEKALVCAISLRAGAAFVKTSTGFGPAGATVADVALMRKAVGTQIGVKASGGIKTLAEVRALLDAGATRIGSSSGVAILAELPA